MSKKTEQDLEEELQEYKQDSCGCGSRTKTNGVADLVPEIDKTLDKFLFSLSDKKDESKLKN